MQSTIVIGAGILGASTAYHLAKEGVNVTLVDRKDTGQATEAAAGIVCPWLTQRRNKPWYRLVKGGAKYYPTLIQELEDQGETETGYARVGAINIFDTDEKLEKKMEIARQRLETAPEMGEVTKLSAEETKKLFPVLSDEYGAVHISGGARVNGGELRDALIRGAKKKVLMPPYNKYMLTFNDGKIVVGATHEDEAGFDNRVTAEAIHEILDKAFKVAPGLAESTYVETKVGFRPFTPGFLPIVGAVPQTKGLYVANGLGASGLTSGPYLGAQLAQHVMGQETELDLNDYDVSTAFDSDKA